PPLSHSYTDFVRWQERRLLSAAAEMDRTYWRRVLSGDLPVLDLPLGRGRPETPSYKGVSEVMALEKDQLAALREMAARRGTTLYTVLLSAFMVWLHRYTGDRDLVVGSPTLGRTRPEFRPVVGFFANPLPLRADFEGDPPFKDFLARVHGVVCGALEHQDLPLEEIIRIVRPPRDRGRTPLFQVLFGWDRPESGRRPAPASSAWLDPHAVLQETFKVEYRVALLDLGAIAVESGDQVSLHFQFSSDLFDAETRSRMLGHFRTLLAAIPSQEDRPLSRISFMDREERVRALSMGHPERKAEHEENEEDETPVPVRFEAQVERTPDGVAVISERGRLTYRQLNEWANRLAHHLIQAGAGRGSLVGLCLPPSPERIASLLAILKTGAAYLPLDPSTPVVRLEQMMRTAAPPYLIICGPEASPSAPGGTQVIDLLKESEQVAACPAHNPGRRPSSRDLAYVIFTSGSTGSPKGVMVPHGAVSNLVASFMESYAPGPSDRMIQQTSISFDASVGEIFPLLCAGGGLVLPRPEELQDPGLMADLMARQKVSIMAGIPSLLARFNEMEEARRPRPRLILSGAEPLALAHVDRFVGVCRVTNAYGPTEATVCATVFDLDDLALLEEGRDGVPGGLDPRRVLPIGRPIRRTRVYVLDRHGQPVPQGVTGEIHIGGAGLALGYLNDPELTARRFIPDPTGEGDGSRLYRTGDLGRLDARGFLHFKGRADQQVKIRGFRVEMEEVRQSLLRHPQVGEAHVAARPDGASGKRLVAYLAGRDGGAAPPVREIRHWLTDRLPRQMVPAAFIWMERLPKSPSGKVAAGALPEPDGAEAAPAPASRAPVTPLQKSLARIWSELLHRRDVNLTDDFFDLGGNSLMEMQLLARVQAQFQRRFPVGRFHREPTLQYLAHLVEQDDSASLPACLMEIQPGGARPPLFFVHSLTGLASEYLSLAAALGPQQPFYALQAVGRNGGGDGEATLEEMASRYIEAIRKIQPSGPYHLGGWSMGGAVAFEMSRNLEAQGEQVAFLALVDAPFPIRRSGRPLSEGLINRSVLSTLALSFGVSAGDLLALLGPGGTDPESSLDRLLAAARAGGLLPGRMERDELRRILEISRENMRCLAAYRPGKYPGRIDFFQAQSSVLQTGGGTGRLSRSMAWVFRRLAAGEPAAWKNLASGELQVHTVPGNHFTLMRPPHVRSTALVLERCLERCRRGAGEMAGETRR
ncbi:MAG: amino acid adenylation domain-containing protein, partial [Acidobacteriota bacterium]